MSKSWEIRWQSQDLNLGSLVSGSLILVAQLKFSIPWPGCIWMNLPSKHIWRVSLQQPQTSSQAPALQRLLGQLLCLCREEGSWQEQLFSSARMSWTSSTVNKFSSIKQVGRFHCVKAEYRHLSLYSEIEISHYYKLHALSSPPNKSFKKVVTIRLGYLFLSRIGNCLE